MLMEQQHPVDAFFARFAAAEVTMLEICERAGVAQSTPSRWKSDRAAAESANLGTLRKLNDALSELISERQKAA